MDTVGAVANVIGVGLQLLKDHIDDPKRRLKATQDYIDRCREEVTKILAQKDMEELDRLLLDFVSRIHDL